MPDIYEKLYANLIDSLYTLQMDQAQYYEHYNDGYADDAGLYATMDDGSQYDEAGSCSRSAMLHPIQGQAQLHHEGTTCSLRLGLLDHRGAR